MGGRGSNGWGGWKKAFYKSAMKDVSDKQIISEKRKYSGFNTKGQFVMSTFDANYRFKGFGSEQIQKNSNKYLELKGSHVSKDGNNAIVNISENHVFSTKYGHGVVVDASHTVFIKDWQILGRNRTNNGVVINFNRDYYKVKEWGDHSEKFSNDSKTALNSFDKVVKLANDQRKFYAKNAINFTF